MNKRMTKPIRNAFLAIAMTAAGAFPMSSQAAVLTASGGVTVTPTQYQVTIQKVEFLRADGTYFTFFEGNAAFDLAGVAAGGTSGSFGSGASLEPGVSYTAMRMTIADSFVITASATDANTLAGGNQGCFTGGAGGTAAVGVVNLTIAQAGVGTPASQTIAIPTDVGANTTVSAALSGAGLETLTGAIRFSAPLAITIPALDTTPPAGLDIDFDVVNTVEFIETSGLGTTCRVMPLPPIVTVTTPSGVTTLDSGL